MTVDMNDTLIDNNFGKMETNNGGNTQCLGQRITWRLLLAYYALLMSN